MVKVYPKGTWVELTPRFSSTDWDCKCRNPECKTTLICTDLVAGLDILWTKVGEFDINSGYRCPAHNLSVGGKPGGYHPRGKAADLEPKKVTVLKLFEAAREIDVFRDGGLGLYRDFLHADSRGYTERWWG